MPNEFVARNGVIALNNSQVTGSLSVTAGITGSLFGTASQALTASFITNAVSSSFAATASSADNLTVRGTLTAQTIVAQVITSSTDFVTGSTRFGTLLTNTHTFTGSVNVTGSMSVMGGNVGIGTTSPTRRLHIYSSDDTRGVMIEQVSTSSYSELHLKAAREFRIGTGGTATVTGAVNSFYVYDATAGTFRLSIDSSGNTALGVTSADSTSLRIVPTSTDTVQRVLHIGYNGSMTTGTHGSLITFGNTTPSTAQLARIGAFYEGGTYMGSLRFYTNTDTEGASPSERMRITQGGNVGIGTTSPLFNLQVGANAGTIATTTLRLQNSYLDSSGNFGFNIDAVDNGINGHDLRFLGRTSGTEVFSELVRVKNSGNVGIGTTSPNAKLDVNGNTIITGSLTVITGSAIELRVTNTGVNIGNIVSDTHTVTGSLNVSGSITGSLFGTSSWANNAVTASHAITASFLLGSVISASFASTASSVNRLTQNVSISGSLTVSGSSVAASLQGSGSAVFSVDGTLGRLFQVDDTLSGSLFSVNTAGGVPLIEAFSDNTVRMGQFGSRVFFVSQSRVGVGKELALGATLDVSGSALVTGSLSVSQGVTASLFGTASVAVTASFAVTAAFALNSGGGGSAFPFNGDAMITGSLNITSPTIGSTRYIYGYTSSLSGSLSVVSTAATSSFRAAFYNYVAASGSNARAGQIAAVWYLSTCSFSETVTTDIGTTSNLDVTARLSGGSIQLVALANTSNWIVETSVNLV